MFEVWDLLLDVSHSLLSFDEKVAAVRRRLPGWTVAGAWVIRGTRRNRALVLELGPLFRTRFPAVGGAWPRALDDPTYATPRDPGLLWTDEACAHLSAARRAPRPTDDPRRG